MSNIDPTLVRDWAAVRAKLAELVETTNAEETDTPAGERAVLAERARRLAHRVDDESQEVEIEILRLTLGGRPYVIGTAGIVAVVREAEIIALPGSSGPVAYLASWRGRLLTTLDLRPRLGLPAPATRSLLVLGATAGEVGLLVDTVDALDTIRESEIQPSAAGGTAPGGYFRGALADATPLLDAAGIAAEHPEQG